MRGIWNAEDGLVGIEYGGAGPFGIGNGGNGLTGDGL